MSSSNEFAKPAFNVQVKLICMGFNSFVQSSRLLLVSHESSLAYDSCFSCIFVV